MLKRSISISLAAMLLIGMAAIFPVKAVTTTLYIDPATSTFYSDTTYVGDTFTVDVKVADVVNMYAYEFQLKWEFAKVELQSAVRPSGHFLEPIVDPANFFVPVWKINETRDATYQTAHFGYTMLAPEVARDGSGLLVTLTFKVLMEPPWMGSVTTTFDLFNTKLANAASPPGQITHDAIDGEYEYIYAPPEATHYLKVNPANTVIPAGAPVVGTVKALFDVYVDLSNLNLNWWVVGIEFKLAYNGTLLDLVSITYDTAFLDGFGTIYMVPPLEGVLPDEFAYVHTAVVLLPHSSPPAHWDNPIYGSGHLMKLTFEVIYQEAFPWFDNSKLDIFDTKYADILGNPVPGIADVDGNVKINGYVIGRQIDMYTQYPEPYGGQSPNAPSDMFWPQKQVELYANVTYNLWPEQNKVVAFEIHNPAGEIVDIITAISDENGVAHTSYRIPWPCFNTSALFGIWNVIATVDIACIVVNDTMSFHFDYMIEWIKVTTYKGLVEETEFAHGDIVHVVVEFQSYAIMVQDVLLTVVIHDELNYPIGKEYKSTTVGDEDMALWCQYANYTMPFDITIPKWAHAGVATIRVNALEGFPWYGYSAWTPEITLTITILPE